MILVDSNVLIDFLDEDGPWVEWSRLAVAKAQSRDDLIVNHVVLAETAGRFTSADEQASFMSDLQIGIHAIDGEGAFRAGQAFRAYRRQGGSRTGILADFLIGGHAAAAGASLLTRDRQRFASYFPELTLITPDAGHEKRNV